MGGAMNEKDRAVETSEAKIAKTPTDLANVGQWVIGVGLVAVLGYFYIKQAYQHDVYIWGEPRVD